MKTIQKESTVEINIRISLRKEIKEHGKNTDEIPMKQTKKRMHERKFKKLIPARKKKTMS